MRFAFCEKESAVPARKNRPFHTCRLLLHLSPFREQLLPVGYRQRPLEYPFFPVRLPDRGQSFLVCLEAKMAVHAVFPCQTNRDFCVPFFNYFGELLEGIAEEAAKEGVHFSLYQTNYQLEKEIFALEQLQLLQCKNFFFQLIICLVKRKVNAFLRSFFSDSFQQLAEIIEKGHTKIAIGLARKNGMNSHFRLKAYKEALAAIGEPYREEWVFERSLTITDGQKLFSEWREMEEKPTGMERSVFPGRHRRFFFAKGETHASPFPLY